ncbi:MAG: YqaA family protein [Gammaproteobacteria bacterium]
MSEGEVVTTRRETAFTSTGIRERVPPNKIPSNGCRLTDGGDCVTISNLIRKFRVMIRENLMKALAGLVTIVIGMSLLGIRFEDELIFATNWVVDRIGFAGLCLILFFSDTIVTPVFPDILLVVVAKSELSEHWPRYVFVLGLVSVVAGMMGWMIGRSLGHLHAVQQFMDQFSKEQRDFIRKYGFWGVVLGATTPLPYSVTCWTAGAAGVRWQTVLAASLLFRIPRIIVYYLLIASAINLFG